jgi:hypothetical protein
MPDVEANRRQWAGDYAWPEGGDEWSAGWGGSDILLAASPVLEG